MTVIVPDPEIAMTVAAKIYGVSCQDMKARSSGFEMLAIMDGHNPVGVIAIKGPEIHAGVTRDYRGRVFNRRILKTTLWAVVKKNGYAITTVRKSNAVGQDFVSRLGFYPVGEDANCIHYRVG